jgi:WhiB family redox-sensing transcriptional regulator
MPTDTPSQATARTARKDRIGRNRPPAAPIALANTPGPGRWVTQAHCRQSAWEVFFPGRGQDLETAKDICAHCPVIDACRDYAIPISELHGVWGGLSENERRRARKARAVAARAEILTPTPETSPPTPASDAAISETPAPRPQVPTPTPTPADQPPPATPAVRRRAPVGSLEARLTNLARRPGRWVRVARYQSPGSASTTASLLRHGRRPIPAGCWEFDARRGDRGGSELWARFAPLPAQRDHLQAVGQ